MLFAGVALSAVLVVAVFFAVVLLLVRRAGAFLTGFFSAGFSSGVAVTSAVAPVVSVFGLERLVLVRFGFSSVSAAGLGALASFGSTVFASS